MAHETVTLIDVRRFGSFGDGINDDGRAIQAAANALKEFSGFRGGSVGLPPGRYLISTPVTLPDGITIQGVGADTVLVLPSSAVSYSAFVLPATRSAEFQNVQFEGPVASVGTIYAVEKQGVSGDLRLTHVTAVNPANANILMPNGCRFILVDCDEVGEDVDVTAGGPYTLTHLSDGLWVGNNQPRQIKGDIDPSAGAGVAAPAGSIYQSSAGSLFVKFGPLDTDWMITVGVPTPLSNNPPLDVGTTSAGIGAAASRDDHVHAHGAQALGVGTDHAAVTVLVNGFMSAADKVILDALAAGGVGTSREDFLLDNEPVAVGTTYTPTYAATLLTVELWAKTAGAIVVKTIDYTYIGSLVDTEIRRVFDDATGAIIVAQVTFTYSYLAGVLTGSVMTRDV